MASILIRMLNLCAFFFVAVMVANKVVMVVIMVSMALMFMAVIMMGVAVIMIVVMVVVLLPARKISLVIIVLRWGVDDHYGLASPNASFDYLFHLNIIA